MSQNQNTQPKLGNGEVTSFIRRRPLVGVYCGVATLYAANAGLYFANGKPGFGAAWAAMTAAWLGGAYFWNKAYEKREQRGGLR